MANNEIIVQSNLSTSTQPTRIEAQQAVTINVAPISASFAVRSETQQKTNLTNSTAEQESNRQVIEETVSQLNDYVQNYRRNLQFSLDEDSGATVIKVTDAETDELIRQIPSEEALKLRNAIEQYRGILFETKT